MLPRQQRSYSLRTHVFSNDVVCSGQYVTWVIYIISFSLLSSVFVLHHPSFELNVTGVSGFVCMCFSSSSTFVFDLTFPPCFSILFSFLCFICALTVRAVGISSRGALRQRDLHLIDGKLVSAPGGRAERPTARLWVALPDVWWWRGRVWLTPDDSFRVWFRADAPEEPAAMALVPHHCGGRDFAGPWTREPTWTLRNWWRR